MSFLTTNPNRHLITIPSLNGVVNSAYGGGSALATSVNTLLEYIDVNKNTGVFNSLRSYTKGSNINVSNNLNLSNTSLLFNGSNLLTSDTLNTRGYTAFQVNSSEYMRLTPSLFGVATNLRVNGEVTVTADVSIGGEIYMGTGVVLKPNVLNNLNYTTFSINGIDKMRLTNVGLGINTSTPKELLHVKGNAIFDTGSLYISSFGAALTSSIGNVYADGDIFANGIKYPSDPRLKDNIRPYTLRGGLPQPVEFTWKSTGQRDIGVLADDVQTIEPLCAHTLANGNLSVDYPKLVVLCLAELKEQRVTIEELRKEIQQLRQ